MLLHGVEVDGVAGRKLKCLHTDRHFKFALDQVDQFHSRVVVGNNLFLRQRMEMRQVTIQLSLVRVLTCLLFPLPLTYYCVVFGRAGVRHALGRKTLWRGREV